MKIKRTFVLYCLILFADNIISLGKTSAEPVKITIGDADSLFVKNNIELIAKHYDMDIAQAQVIQSKLFDNPVISFTENLYNRSNSKWLDFGNHSEQTFDIEQELAIAGKRSNKIKLAKANAEIAKYQYAEAVRTLYGEVNDHVVNLYFDLKKSSVYNKEITALDNLVKAYQQQEVKGNVSLLESSRLQSELLSLRKEQNELENSIVTERQTLNVLLGLPAATMLEANMDETELKGIDAESINYQKIDASLIERPDIQMATAGIKVSEMNLKLQKSMAYPTLSARAGYDRNGGVWANYSYVGFGVSVPIFDRNQGNIKAARRSIDQSNYEHADAMMKAEAELRTAYGQWQNAVALYKNTDNTVEANFTTLMNGAISNFTKRNINMIEFLDYYESYKNTCLQLYDIRRDVFLNMNGVNLAAGRNVFKY